MIQIPVTNQPNQSFQVSIPQGTSNLSLGFYIYWNRIAEYWQMTLTNIFTGVEIANGIPLITGADPAQNLLAQYGYLEIGEAYVVPLSDDAGDHPGEEGWGTNFILLWSDT